MKYNPVTNDMADRIYESRKHGPDSLEAKIYNLSRTRDGIDSTMQIPRMREAWSKVFVPGTTVDVAAYDWEYEDGAIVFEVTDDPLGFSIQREGVPRTGERTIDTFWIKSCSVRRSRTMTFGRNQNSTKRAEGPIISAVYTLS